jgi:ribosome-binding protein aMBF1 (putative translation factor)
MWISKTKKMLNRDLINKIMQLKQDRGFTLHDLSKKIDIPVSTVERWFKTGRINKLYAEVVKDKLGIH